MAPILHSLTPVDPQTLHLLNYEQNPHSRFLLSFFLTKLDSEALNFSCLYQLLQCTCIRIIITLPDLDLPNDMYYPGQKKLGQPRASGHMRVISRACTRLFDVRACLNFFGQGSSCRLVVNAGAFCLSFTAFFSLWHLFHENYSIEYYENATAFFCPYSAQFLWYWQSSTWERG